MSTDLKPGDIVRHAEHGYGTVVRTRSGNALRADYASFEGRPAMTRDLTGWERVETVKPGHVQVRVDDLGMEHLAERWSKWGNCDPIDTVCSRIGRAYLEQRENAPEPVKLSHPEPTEFGAKATFTFFDDGRALRFIRLTADESYPWLSDEGVRCSWDELTDTDGERGSLTLGWDE